MAENLNLPMLLRDANISMEFVLTHIKYFRAYEINQGKKCVGEYHLLFPQLKAFPDKFKQYTRMDVNTFAYLLSKTEDRLSKNWCNLHKKTIVAEERLVVTLRFLATGSSFSDLSDVFKMGKSTVSVLVREAMDILWEILMPLHMPAPTQEGYLKVARKFYTKWNFPHCIGVLDGRHIPVKNLGVCFPYLNYQKFSSLILLAVVDANCKFVSIDVGGCGSQSDNTFFRESSLYKCLITKRIKVPDDDWLPNSTTILPYFFIAVGGYALTENLMKPYPLENYSRDKKVFNDRLLKVRTVADNAFGYMCEKWKIFKQPIDKSLPVVESIVKCATVLHNVLIDLEHENIPVNLTSNLLNISEPGTYEQEDLATGLGKEVRNELKRYFEKKPSADRVIGFRQINVVDDPDVIMLD